MAGSFRDPAGGVVLGRDRAYRYFLRGFTEEFSRVTDSGLLPSLIDKGMVVPTAPVPRNGSALYDIAPDVELVVEHPRIPFISYPYEWPFEMLKAAALLHLDVLEAALAAGFTLKDATPYNVQFMGPDPLIIDVASFEAYQPGSPWMGYTQFCRTFLNPLILQSALKIPYQTWLRSSLEGIDPAQLSRLLPLNRKLRKDIFMDVVLQAWLNRKSAASQKQKPKGAASSPPRPIPKEIIVGMIRRLSRFVARMKRPGKNASIWLDYEANAPYEAEALEFKDRFVEAAVSEAAPRVVWDLGCNTGRYSEIAARHTQHVVAMDFDEAVVGAVYERVRERSRNVLPLVIDLMNPSPSQGWGQSERMGLLERGPADFAVCLALVHHLAIAGNVPLPRIAEWLGAHVQSAVVEFVPKNDPMVQTLLRTRPDVFPDYTQAAFEEALKSHFTITSVTQIPKSERVLFLVAGR